MSCITASGVVRFLIPCRSTIIRSIWAMALRWILGSQSRSLVTERAPALRGEQRPRGSCLPTRIRRLDSSASSSREVCYAVQRTKHFPQFLIFQVPMKSLIGEIYARFYVCCKNSRNASTRLSIFCFIVRHDSTQKAGPKDRLRLLCVFVFPRRRLNRRL